MAEEALLDPATGKAWLSESIQKLTDMKPSAMDTVLLPALLLATVCVDGSADGRKLSDETRAFVIQEMATKFSSIAQGYIQAIARTGGVR